jgi:outer membrane protein TolC
LEELMSAIRRIMMCGGLGALAAALSLGVWAQEPGAAMELTLQDALKAAMQNNYNIRVERVAYQESEWALKGAYGQYDPLLALDWNAQVNRQPTTSRLQVGLVQFGAYMVRQDAYNLGLSQLTPWGQTFQLQWDNTRTQTNSNYSIFNPSYSSSGFLGTTLPLLQGFGEKVAHRPVLKAKLDLEAAGSQFEQNLRDSLVQVESDYWALVYTIKDLDVKRKALDLAKRFQEETRKKIEVGILAPIEQVSADAQVATREQDIITAEQAVGDRMDILRLDMGFTKDSPEWGRTIHPADEPAVSTVPGAEAELIQKALSLRPEVKQLQAKVAKDKLDTAWAKNQTLPKLDLAASLTYNGATGRYVNPVTGAVIYDQGFSDAWHQVTGLDYKSWYVGLAFRYPIGNRAARAAYQGYRLAQNADEILLERLNLAVSNEVRAAIRNVEAARMRVEAAKVTLKLQRDKLDAEQKKYENGLSTAFNVLSYQNDLLSAATSLLNAQVGAQVAGAQLDKAVGTYLDSRGVQIEPAAGPNSAAASH